MKSWKRRLFGFDRVVLRTRGVVVPLLSVAYVNLEVSSLDTGPQILEGTLNLTVIWSQEDSGWFLSQTPR